MSGERDAERRHAADFWNRFAAVPPVESPEDQVANGRAIFLLSLHLAQAIGARRITPDTLVNELEVDTADDKSFAIAHTYTVPELDTKAMNLVYAGFGISAIASDAAINPKGQDPKDTGDWGSARNTISQVRNAFPHTPLRPTWDIHEPSRRKYEVKAIGLSFDATRLDGQGFIPHHVGGVGLYWELLKYCERAVKDTPTESA